MPLESALNTFSPDPIVIVEPVIDPPVIFGVVTTGLVIVTLLAVNCPVLLTLNGAVE